MKLTLNANSYKVIIPKSMIEDTLHWNNGDELKVTCDGKKVTIEKKE